MDKFSSMELAEEVYGDKPIKKDDTKTSSRLKSIEKMSLYDIAMSLTKRPEHFILESDD